MENSSLRNNSFQPTPALREEGLRSHMLRIYSLMSLGLVLTGLVAYAAEAYGFTAYMDEHFAVSMTVLLSPLTLGIIISIGITRFNTGTLYALYWTLVALLGLSMSIIFTIYATADIVTALFVTAGAFGALSACGYATKSDLSPWGSFLLMALTGVIIAMIVNSFFIQSASFQIGITLISVLVFAGLTAWHTQELKNLYSTELSADAQSRIVIIGALNLHLTFVNMLLDILNLIDFSNAIISVSDD